MANLPENDLQDVVEGALDAFWAYGAQHFPAADSGDLSPSREFALKNAAEEAIAEWMEVNT